MKAFRLLAFFLLVCAIVTAILTGKSPAPQSESPAAAIQEWEFQWMDAAEPKDQSPLSLDSWLSASSGSPMPEIPDGAVGAWVHLVIPPSGAWQHPGIFIERLYGLNVTVYEGPKPVYRSEREYDFERNILLIPVTSQPAPTDLYLRIESKERAGPSSEILLGEYDRLNAGFVRKELPQLLLGSSIAFLAVMMLALTGYMHRNQRGLSVALCLFALSTGTLFVTYSGMPYFFFGDYGPWLVVLFDMSMYILFPSLLHFVLQISDSPHRFFSKLARWLYGYYAFCFFVTLLYKWAGEPLYFYYKLFTFWMLAPLILLQLILILFLSFRNALRGNKNSIILSAGLILFAAAGVTDLLLFTFSGGRHLLFLWKVGVVLLIASLVMIVNRRISADYTKLLAYSRELELYNHELQRTEKMQIISELAASIAHEVRNPLQVTRGFLQLLSGKSKEENRPHFSMAINELDRASAIISDFLTFAKPELDTLIAMDLKEELLKIEMIMSPMAMMHGGILEVRVDKPLPVIGNPSKLKQALINMIKNSIESLQENGRIDIEACAEGDMAVIRIADNGEGMDEAQIAKLGEPYFSTKTKGTGLGLMVTFRIIEVMKGTLEFRSAKGKGTEAIVRFPLAHSD